MFVNGVESPREILSAYQGREGKEEMLSLHPIRNAIFYKCISLCPLVFSFEDIWNAACEIPLDGIVLLNWVWFKCIKIYTTTILEDTTAALSSWANLSGCTCTVSQISLKQERKQLAKRGSFSSSCGNSVQWNITHGSICAIILVTIYFTSGHF